LPEVAEAMGKSIQKFKKASKDARREIETGLDNNDEEESKKE
jgi:Sec-independent protein translocase protein TatA